MPNPGGFFFTSHDHEALITRPKPGYDNATPSGNGVAAFALQRLGHLLGETRYLDASARCLRLFHPQLTQQPIAYPTLLAVLDEALAPPRVILLRGPAAALREWTAALTPQTRRARPAAGAAQWPDAARRAGQTRSRIGPPPGFAAARPASRR